MIFMRTVRTDKVGLRQVKTYHTDLAVTSLCMAVNGIHDPQTCPKLMAVNEIHSFMMTSMTHLTWVTVSEGLHRSLRLNSSLACQLLNSRTTDYICREGCRVIPHNSIGK